MEFLQRWRRECYERPYNLLRIHLRVNAIDYLHLCKVDREKVEWWALWLQPQRWAKYKTIQCRARLCESGPVSQFPVGRLTLGSVDPMRVAAFPKKVPSPVAITTPLVSPIFATCQFSHWEIPTSAPRVDKVPWSFSHRKRLASDCGLIHFEWGVADENTICRNDISQS